VSRKLKTAFLFVLGVVSIYLIGSFVWSILNTQVCTGLGEKGDSCEEIARKGSENCRYVILRWKRVSYEHELKKCLDWEQKQ